MNYIKTNKSTGFPEKESFSLKLIKILLFFVPRANPTYDAKMHLVSEWLIEFDAKGFPNREIGLEKNGSPVLAGPNKKDYGFWLDTNMVYSDFKDENIPVQVFEEKWEEFHLGTK